VPKNRVNDEVKKAWIYLLQFSKPNNQYCIATLKGIESLKFKESYELEK